MAVFFKLLLLVLAATCLAEAFQGLPRQQRLFQGESQDPGIFGDASFDKFIMEVMHEYHVPGLSLAVIDNDQIAAMGYGIAELPDTPATPDTLYYTGSTTKAFTAAAASLLIQDQDQYPGLKWTSPINQFLREDFVLQDDHATTHTSIEDALSHRSGLPRHDLSWGELDGTPSSVVKSLRYLPMTAEPRTTFQYCNIMYAVVTDLLEKLTGLKLETILHDKIWGPLGMASTSFGGLDAQSNLARGYYWNAEQDDSSVTEGRSSSESYYVPEPHLNLSDISGAGATISSVNDYALWIKAFLDTASTTKPRNASSPINPALYRDVLTPRTIMQLLFGDTSPSEFLTPPLYALGWFILSIDGHKIVGHGGGLPGFGTTIWFLPDDGYGVVAMGNTAGTSNIVGSIIAQVLLKQKLGLSIKQSLSAEAGLHAAFSDPHLRQDTHQRNRNHSSEPHTRRPDISQPSRPPAKVAKLPLPGDISDYAGIYVHPAYGMINFTVFMTQCHHSRQDTVEAHSSSTYLYGIHSPKRILSYALEFHHVTDTLFTSELYLPHGMDSEIIWEHESSSRAIFKFGLTGEEVETLGIELDEEMVEAARRKGEKYWKEGMIWFEKVE